MLKKVIAQTVGKVATGLAHETTEKMSGALVNAVPVPNALKK